MGSIFVDDDDADRRFLFYTVAKDKDWSKSSISLATSSNSIDFRQSSEDILIEGRNDSFCKHQALNPAVTRVKNRFYMIFAGKDSPRSPRKIGIAFADDLKGPWHIIGELIHPSHFWEGTAIDNGCTVVKLNDETLLLYYSSLTSPKIYDVSYFLRRYPTRRIGILKVRVNGTSLSSIEAMRFSGNPLKHLNGPKNSWNESVFCPGYVKLDGKHYLFPAASTYSLRFPFKQHIGIVGGNTPYFLEKTSQALKLIDGPVEKNKIMPGIKSEIAIDTPSAYVDVENRKLLLYYSVADRADEVWKIALTAFDLTG